MSALSAFLRRPVAARLAPLGLGLAALLSVALFLIYAGAAGVAPGFPLDDAWIHQTYARNLAHSGQWAYTPGVPSAGSTSPLWTLALSAGYLLRLPYRAWTLFLGWLALTATAWAAMRLTRRLFPARPALPLLAGLFCALEWHLVWAAVSGMETLLFCALALMLLAEGATAPPASVGRGMLRGAALGLLAGALTLTRPEGLLLAALLGLQPWTRLLWERRRADLPLALGHSAGLAAGCLLPLAPYLAFNLSHSGSLFPNTFYAKQVEYAPMVAGWSLPARWGRVVGPTLVGAQVVLAPGLLWAAWLTVRGVWARRAGRPAGEPASALPLLYWGLFTLVYAARLPVGYQHGRYLMPTIPLLVVLGLGGTAALLDGLPDAARRRLIRAAAGAAVALLLAGFLIIGAGGYSADVDYINGEMVAVAGWLNAHTPADALIAAHDIGAVGYFTQRPLLDLAGLVSPEIIPIMHDGPALLDYLLRQGANYVVIFPAWYPWLSAAPQLERVYQTEREATRAAGQDNMAVYRLTPR